MCSQIAYTIDDAAAQTGYSKRVIQLAITAGDITPRYANSKPVIPHTELVAWVDSLPVDKPS